MAGGRMTVPRDVEPRPRAGRPSPPSSGPSLGGAVRAAVTDFFFNSWRVVPLNVAWGVVFLLALGLGVLVHPLLGLVALCLTAVPLAGLARLAARATRGLGVNLSDAAQPIRARPVAVLLAGVAFVASFAMLTVNLVAGFALGNALGWAFATAAGWGLATGACVACTFWPLLADPERDGASAPAVAKLAAVLVLAHPFRIGVLAVLLVVLLAVSTVAFAALVSVSVAFALLVAARYVLPAADRLEARMVELGRMAPLRIPSDVEDD